MSRLAERCLAAYSLSFCLPDSGPWQIRHPLSVYRLVGQPDCKDTHLCVFIKEGVGGDLKKQGANARGGCGP